MSDRERPSALIALGVYAGVIAALAILPAAIPLMVRLVSAETRASAAQMYAETAAIGLALDRGAHINALPSPSYLRAVTTEGVQLLEQGDVRPEAHLEDQVCGEPSGILEIALDGHAMTAACFENSNLRVLAIRETPSRSFVGIAAFIVALATVAGLVTALGVLRILRPLSKISAALNEVGLGRRGVRMAFTGLSELDELVQRLNAAATAVEEREHAILSRVRVVQELARLVAHEIRNPLQSLELLTTLLADESDPGERRQLAGSIHAEIRALDDVVTRLLREGATRGSLRLRVEPCDLAVLLSHIQNLRSAEAREKGATIDVEHGYRGDLPLDRALFSRTLENLVANAIRAVPAGGGRVRIRTRQADGALFIDVDDNGPGVDPALGDTVFEPNVSGMESHGLGLALAKGVVEAHRGRIRFTTSDLGGARFEVRMPLSPESEAR